MVSSTIRAPILAVFSGSSRVGSVNTKLANVAARMAGGLGAEVHHVNLAAYKLPLYSQDLESSASGDVEFPQAALDLKEDLAKADGWIVASPEYNGFPTPLLLNAMTWASRGDPPGEMYQTFAAKSAIVVSASPGAMGGMRAINPTRQLLTNLGVNVLPNSVAIGGAFKAFGDTENGKDDLLDPKLGGLLSNAVSNLYYLTRDTANRDATCEIIRQHAKTVGEYGSVSVAEA